MTIKEIAKALDLSAMTVSICLSHRENDPRYRIRAENAERVRAFARRHGYVPNLSARRLRRGSSDAPIGIVFSHSSGFQKSVPALRRAVELLSYSEREYQMIGYHSRTLSVSLETLAGMGVREVLLFGPLSEPCPIHYPYNYNRDNPSSSLMVDRWLADWKRCEVLLNSMTLYALEYCFPRPVDGGIKNGLVRIGLDLFEFIPEVLRKIKDSGMGPVAAVRWISQEKKLVPEVIDNEALIFPIEHTGSRYDEGRRLVDKLLEVRKKHHFRSIFIGNDGVAAGVIAELSDRGFAIPEDIAVLGYGNEEVSSCLRVPLSTFELNLVEDTENLIKAILEKKEINKETLRSYKYIERESFKFPV